MFGFKKRELCSPAGAIGVLSACLLLVLTTASFAHSEPLNGVPHSTVTLFDRGEMVHLVHWRARTVTPGGSFHLYQGTRLNLLELAETRPAVVGIGDYSSSEETPRSDWFFYQLRYVHPSGAEAVLATIVVNQQSYDDVPWADIATHNFSKAVVGNGWAEPAFGARLSVNDMSTLPVSDAPSPEVPPPRRPWLEA